MKTEYWTDKEKELLISSWKKIDFKELRLLFPNRTSVAVKKMAKRIGLDTYCDIGGRKYSFNRSFFNIPNIENCYWAGFIAADGCIVNRDRCVSISLARKDKVILESLKNAINYSGPVRDGKQCINGKEYFNSRLLIHGAEEFLHDLNVYFNITEKKSLTLEPPNLIDLDLIYSYIIGFFDGDGTAAWEKTNWGSGRSFIFGFVGTLRMMEWIKSHLDVLALPTLTGTSITYSRNLPSLYYRGKRAIEIHKALRNIKLSFRLSRKWNIDYDN